MNNVKGKLEVLKGESCLIVKVKLIAPLSYKPLCTLPKPGVKSAYILRQLDTYIQAYTLTLFLRKGANFHNWVDDRAEIKD